MLEFQSGSELQYLSVVFFSKIIGLYELNYVMFESMFIAYIFIYCRWLNFVKKKWCELKSSLQMHPTNEEATEIHIFLKVAPVWVLG